MILDIQTILKESLTITCFVIIMLLLIEYFNVKTRGRWFKSLKNSSIKQVILGAFMGFLPGCIGGYAIVSLYTHNVVGFGSLLAAFIATAGDETFIMLSVFPITALYIMGGLLVVGIIAGLLADLIIKNKKQKSQIEHFEIHEHETCDSQTGSLSQMKQHLKRPSFARSILVFGLIVFIIFLITGIIGHNHDAMHICEEGHDHHHHHNPFFVIEEWMYYSFIVLASIALYIIMLVSEHFLTEHLWKHIIKKHFLKIFLWIIGSIAVIQLFLYYVNIEQFSNEELYYWAFCAIAIGIGIIPQSGPHIIFISLFSQQIIPLSILLINTIVHEGHASLPLFAESKKSFVKVKLIKIGIALLMACLGYFIGF
jgi:hypothetical protein